METIDAIILGIIQGLTEFLPVSSSGHIELTKAILGDGLVAEQSLLFTIVLHFATALSTVVVFYKDILELFKGLFAFKKNEQSLYVFKIVISMIPAIVVGLLLEEQLSALFTSNVLLVGLMLIITAILLILTDRATKSESSISVKSAGIIGIAQAIAMLPGISRSGATIATAVLLKTDSTKAARFSFLMVIPLIFGKIAKDALSGDIVFNPSDTTAVFAGFIAAFVFGLIACKWMISLVRRSKLHYFGYYCAAVGILSIAYTLVA
jgi:undecaprenyl-diphosphatase